MANDRDQHSDSPHSPGNLSQGPSPENGSRRPLTPLLGLNLIRVAWLLSFLLSFTLLIAKWDVDLSFFFTAASVVGIALILPGMFLGCRNLPRRTGRAWMALFGFAMLLTFVSAVTSWGAFMENEESAGEWLLKSTSPEAWKGLPGGGRRLVMPNYEPPWSNDAIHSLWFFSNGSYLVGVCAFLLYLRSIARSVQAYRLAFQAAICLFSCIVIGVSGLLLAGTSLGVLQDSGESWRPWFLIPIWVTTLWLALLSFFARNTLGHWLNRHTSSTMPSNEMGTSLQQGDVR